MSHYEKKEKKKREEKDPLSSPSSPQNLQVFKRGMRKKFLKGVKYSPSPFLHPYITTPNPYTFTTYHPAYTHAYLDLIV
jgi:hypothetical protein